MENPDGTTVLGHKREEMDMIERVKEYDKLGELQKEVLKCLDDNRFRRGGAASGWMWDTMPNTIKILRSLTSYDRIIKFPLGTENEFGRVIRVVELAPGDNFELQDRIKGNRFKTFENPHGEETEIIEEEDDDVEYVDTEEDSEEVTDLDDDDDSDIEPEILEKIEQIKEAARKRAKESQKRSENITPAIKAQNAAPATESKPESKPEKPVVLDLPKEKDVAFVPLMNGTTCYVGRLARGKASHAVVYSGDINKCIDFARKWNQQNGVSADDVVAIMDSI